MMGLGRMHSPRRQRTIAQAERVEGYGYWSGRDIQVEFRPAAPDAGIQFVRVDLDPPVPIAVATENRIDVPRRTTLRRGTATVEMVEHILAALGGLGIDNCEVHVNAPEMPGLDGSCQAFVEALDRAGVVLQDAPREAIRIDEPLRVGDAESWIEARPTEHEGLSIQFHLDYGTDNPIGRQTLWISVTPDSFRRELAPSRTFLLRKEAQWLRQQGLGLRTTEADLLVFDEAGPIQNELRYEDECVRHKILDLVGDLTLAGCDLVGHIVAFRSGHQLNAQLVNALCDDGALEERLRRTA